MYLILSFPRPSQRSSVPEDKTRGRRDSGSGRVTSPPPISLGRKVEVDLKEKQRKFEGLDRKAEQVIRRITCWCKDIVEIGRTFQFFAVDAACGRFWVVHRNGLVTWLQSIITLNRIVLWFGYIWSLVREWFLPTRKVQHTFGFYILVAEYPTLKGFCECYVFSYSSLKSNERVVSLCHQNTKTLLSCSLFRQHLFHLGFPCTWPLAMAKHIMQN